MVQGKGRNRYRASIGLVGGLCLSVTSVLADTQPEAPFSWLSGCWQHTEGHMRETWTEDYGGILFGHAVALEGDTLTGFEVMRLQRGKEGWVFIASPNGVPPTHFPLVDLKENEATFENPDHDFPQRIRYARKGEGLLATASTRDGRQSRDFPMTPCEAGN